MGCTIPRQAVRTKEEGHVSENGAPTETSQATLQFPCKACGADMAFQAGAEALVCSYCGYREEIPRSADEIAERDFDSYDDSNKERGWGTARREIQCQACGAVTSVEPQVTSTECAFCGSAHVEDRAATSDMLKPESLVPFAIERDEVKQRFKTWLSKLWFRPSALKSMAVADKLRGVYVPFWTFDTLTNSHWKAESGTYYYETETYTETGSGGQTETKTRQVRKVRWRWVYGTHAELFDDVLVPASQGIDTGLASRLRYDTSALVPYKPDYLVALGAEDYQLGMKDAWPIAKANIDDAIRAACSRKVPGDTQRNLSVRTSYHNRTYKLCLLPVWVATYRFQNKVYRYLCNGQTGVIEGHAPYSWWKIGLTAAGVVAVITALVLLLSS